LALGLLHCWESCGGLVEEKCSVLISELTNGTRNKYSC